MTANELGQVLAGANVFFTIISLLASALGIGVFLREVWIEARRRQSINKYFSDQLSVLDE